jgi:hypothetical protein
VIRPRAVRFDRDSVPAGTRMVPNTLAAAQPTAFGGPFAAAQSRETCRDPARPDTMPRIEARIGALPDARAEEISTLVAREITPRPRRSRHPAPCLPP